MYRRILRRKFPFRKRELQSYEIDIARIHARYGAKFYDYHLAFSKKAAEAVKLGVLIYSALRDNDELMPIIGGTKVRQCEICQSTAHKTDFCDPRRRWQGYHSYGRKDTSKEKERTPKTDKHARPIIMHDGKMVCINFNNQKCDKRDCFRLQVCSVRFNANHTSIQCPNNKQTSNISSQDLSKTSKSD